MDDQQCVFSMYGGEISGNNGNNYGGAIFRKFDANKPNTTGGAFNMYGGTIKNNTAKNGGAFFSTTGGTIKIEGGTITGNKATMSSNNAGGGAIYMRGSGTITISGSAAITGNASSLDGGAILMGWGTITISGSAKINNNTASRWGGAICQRTDANNVSTLNMTGGELSGNKANAEGGAVHVTDANCTFNLSGGTVKGNTAKGNGGGIYVNPSNSGKLKISGAPVVNGNTVSGTANNVYLPSGKTLTIADTMTDGALIGVTTENKNYPVVFSDAYNTNYEGFFAADAAGAGVEYNTGDKKLYLVVRKYIVTVETEGNGTASATPTSAVAATEITLTATPGEDSHFKGWKTDHPEALINGNRFTMPADNVVVKAIFETHDFTAEIAEEQYLKSGATCTEPKVYYKSCTVCGLSSAGTAEEATFFSGNVPGHDWGEWTQNSDGETHTRVCRRDESHTETKDCTGGKATCTAKAVCEVCGKEYGDLLPHDFAAEVAEEQYLKSAATCTEPAEYYKSCTTCGLSSAGTAEEVTFFSGNVPGHDWGEWTQNSDGETHTRVCKRDESHTETLDCTGGTATCMAKAICEDCKAEYGETDSENHAEGCTLEWTITKTDHEQKYSLCGKVSVEKVEHTFGDWTVTQKPTSNRGGEKERLCEVCKYKETNTIPAVGSKDQNTNKSNTNKTNTNKTNIRKNNSSPKTSDSSNLLFWIVLIAASGSGVIGVAVYGKKKKA